MAPGFRRRSFFAQEETSSRAYQLTQFGAVIGASLKLPAIAIPADVRAKLEARAAVRATTIKGRLEKLGEQRAKIRAALKNLGFVDGAEGTSTKAVELDVAATANAKAEKKAKLL